MNSRDLAKQQNKDRILAFAEEFRRDRHRSPSTQEIAAALGLNKTTVWRYLVEMQEDQVILYDGKTIRFPEEEAREAHAGDQIAIPLVGSIPCGAPQVEEAAVEDVLWVSRSLLGAGRFFMLRASGDSMVDAGIDSGDYVIVRVTTEARPGDLVAAIVDNENTLKRLQKDRSGRYYLHPENREKGYADILPEQFSVQGVIVWIMKKV